MKPTDPQPVVLVTGSSTGIGRATVARFAAGGWRVAATMRSPGRSDVSAADTVRLFALDVTDEASIKAAVAATVDAFGRIDAVVNNAGYALQGPIEALSSDAVRRQFETNVVGLVAVTRECLPHLRASKGTIVNVASIGGRMTFPFGSAYHGTKFAVEGISEAMRYELWQHGVRVRIVEPGGIKTDFMTRSIQWNQHAAYEPVMSGFRGTFDRFEKSLPGPEPVADVIFAATTSRGARLRWLAKPGAYYWLARVLPDPLWRASVGFVLRRSLTTGLPVVSARSSRRPGHEGANPRSAR